MDSVLCGKLSMSLASSAKVIAKLLLLAFYDPLCFPIHLASVMAW